ncbi:MAG TPA: hypothetical protein VN721_13025 [Flavipsychrobacter sp.]|nr:hypothetical protein [Flavipsychrobacter sp.]
MKATIKTILLPLVLFILPFCSYSQGNATASIRTDAAQIVVGDQAHLFIEVHNNPGEGRLQWAEMPDTFNHLQIVERSKIDTAKEGNTYSYKQRITITGFDSGAFTIPAFVFSVIPNTGTPYTVQTDSLKLSVNTIAVDTTKPFKPIKGIILIKGSWLDYIWIIVGALIFILLVVFIIIYFVVNKKTPIPQTTNVPNETLEEKILRILAELDAQQLWQNKKVKEYYVQLTDIIRYYIEQRFKTPALELTTNQILQTADTNKEMQPHKALLASILYTADLAKFAKAQPFPHEHIAAMENARQFVEATRPVIVAPETNTTQTQQES